MKKTKSFEEWKIDYFSGDLARKYASETEITKAYKNYLENEKSEKEPIITATSKKYIQLDNLDKAIGIVEKAKIAKEAIKHFPHDELNEVADLLDGASEVRKAVEELNMKLKPIYENLLYESLDEIYRSEKYQDKREDLLHEIIKIGLRGVIKENNFSDGELPLPSTREIKTSSKWKELKDRL